MLYETSGCNPRPVGTGVTVTHHEWRYIKEWSPIGGPAYRRFYCVFCCKVEDRPAEPEAKKRSASGGQ